MIEFIQPGLLGDKSTFKQLFEEPIGRSKREACDPSERKIARRRAWLLYHKVSPYILRRDAGLLMKYLPSKHEMVIVVRITDVQLKLYKKFIEILMEAKKTRKVSLFWTFNVLTMLCNHPDTLLLYRNWKNKNIQDLDKKIQDGDSLLETEMEKMLMDIENQKDEYNFIEKLLSNKEEIGFQQGVIENSAKMIIMLDIIKQSKKMGDKVILFSRSIRTLGKFSMKFSHIFRFCRKLLKINEYTVEA